MKVEAQNQNHVWSIVPKAITFGNTGGLSTNLLPQINPLQTSQYPSNAMEDVNGNVLFSVYDGTVYTDANGGQWKDIILPNGGILKGGTEVLIIPVPSSCHKYYIVSAKNSGNLAGPNPIPYYIRLNIDNNKNIELQDANGVATLYATSLAGTNTNGFFNYDVHAGTIHMAVTPLRATTNDRFLFIENAQQIYRYKVTDTGIAYDNYTYDLAAHGIPSWGSSLLKSELEIVQLANGNYKMAVPTQYPSGTSYNFAVVAMDVSNSGVIGNYTLTNIGTTANPDRPVGIEFTSDGSMVYIMKTTAPYLIAVNTTSGQTATLTISADFKNSQIELGTDGKLYAAAFNRLGCLSNINLPNTNNWSDQAPGLGTTVFATPGIPQAYGDFINSGYAIRYMPDQIDGENNHNSFLLNEPQCCVDHSEFDVNNNYYAPTGTYTWKYGSGLNPWNVTSPVRVRQKIVIPTGANVTIQDMTFQFGYEGAVEIQIGAVLNMAGTTFTNSSCPIMWKGVKIFGTPSSTLLQLNGVLSMTTGTGFTPSSIENALDAVTMGSGGQIVTYNARFKNNYHGITINPNNLFSTQLQNVINNTTFENPSPLWTANATAPDDYFIYLRGIKNITFVGTNYFTKGTYGITSDDSKYNLSNAHFTNVIYGIWSRKVNAGFSSEHVFDNNIFQTFFYAIRIDGGNLDQITNNQFNTIGGMSYPSILAEQNKNYEAIHLEGSGGFHVTDNAFRRCKDGVFVKNSGSTGGRISSNNGSGNLFTDCWRGVSVFDDNMALQIKCNLFQNANNTSFSTAWFVDGNLPNQGSDFNPEAPAGNEFHHPTTTTQKDIYHVYSSPSHLNVSFNYYHHENTNIPSQPLGNSYCKPTVNASNRVVCQNTGFYKISTTCKGQSLREQSGYDFVVAQGIIDAEANPVRQQLLVNELVAWYREQGMDSAEVNMLTSRNNDAAHRELLDRYTQSFNYTAALNELTNYSANTDEESVNYVALYSILINWGLTNKTPYDLTPDEEITIRNVAATQTRSAITAKSILSLVYDEKFIDDNSDSINGRMIGEDLDSSILNEIKSVIPNPANMGCEISYQIENCKYAELQIRDLQGRLMSKIELPQNSKTIYLSLTNYKAGAYLCTLFADGKNISSYKLFVIRN
jgi:hypothetical protein